MAIEITSAPNRSSGTVDTVMKVNDTQDIKEFIEELQHVVKKSKRNGGCYSMFRKSGTRRIIIECHLPAKM